MIPAERVTRAFIDIAELLVDDFDMVEFLEMAATRTAGLVGAGEAGILLAGPTRQLSLVACNAANPATTRLFRIKEGPCQDCYEQGSAIVNAELETAEQRWPTFAPLALAAGHRSSHTFPLKLRDRVVGVISLLHHGQQTLSDADAGVLQGVADFTTIGLLQAQTIHRAGVLNTQLQTALDSRIAIEQAKGALAQIHQESSDEAYARLRAYCRRHHLRLTDVARDVVAAPERVRELVTPGTPGLTRE